MYCCMLYNWNDSYAILFLQYAIRRFIRSVMRQDSSAATSDAQKRAETANATNGSNHIANGSTNGNSKPLKGE
jgi:hypothetical protein